MPSRIKFNSHEPGLLWKQIFPLFLLSCCLVVSCALYTCMCVYIRERSLQVLQCISLTVPSLPSVHIILPHINVRVLQGSFHLPHSHPLCYCFGTFYFDFLVDTTIRCYLVLYNRLFFKSRFLGM